MFNGIKIPGILFQKQKMNNENGTVLYKNKSDDNQIKITDGEQL
jgi:hypothetical protein